MRHNYRILANQVFERNPARNYKPLTEREKELSLGSPPHEEFEPLKRGHDLQKVNQR